MMNSQFITRSFDNEEELDDWLNGDLKMETQSVEIMGYQNVVGRLWVTVEIMWEQVDSPPENGIPA